MDLANSIIIAVLTFGLLVTFHEYGHFWVARRCGVKVLRFSIGFGTPLVRWHDKQGTEYVIGLIPLGGYVKMVDEREGDVEPEDAVNAFNRKTLGQRSAIVAAGPIANFLLAIAAYWVVFMSGVSGVVPLVGQVTPGSLAEQAGLEAGVEIVSVDGEETPTWRVVRQQLLHRIGETGSLAIGVRYPDSDLIYESEVNLDEWLLGEEQPDLLGSLGLVPWMPQISLELAKVLDDTPASAAGLKAGDRLVSADGLDLGGWQQWVDYVQQRPGEAIELGFERDGELRSTVLTPARHTTEDGREVGRVGVAPVVPPFPDDLVRSFHYNPLSAFGQALSETWSITVLSLESIKKLLTGLISPKNLSGPITIAKVASASAKSGLESWLGVLAFLSINLGILNLLPIPVLDGGHLLFYLVEWIKGSPVSERAQMLGFQLGVSIVVGIMILAIFNDISRL